MIPSPRIKICCIRDKHEAALAIAHGVDALGLVSAMPSGPGVIADSEIAAIAATVPPPIATFLLTASTDADAIIAQQRRCGCNTIQLVDAVPRGTHAALRTALPGIALVQVIHVVDAGSVDEAVALAPAVDALLLDSGNPALAVKELGGTGRVHDWTLSRAIVERCGRPVFLAGGLRPDNVADAIRTVRPFGLDLCNGVRVNGHLDAARLAAFIEAARRA